MERAYLALSSGRVFEGWRAGADVDAIGEVVFTTGMVGCIETLTDPSYAGQIVVQTFPLIGNYGIIEEDFEGEAALRGYIARELCPEPSNFRAQTTVDAFLRERGIPALVGIDTRELTRVIREEGVMNGTICSSVPSDMSAVKSFEIKGAVASVCDPHGSRAPAQGERRARAVLIDYGAKRNIIRCLCARGVEVEVVPHDTPAERIMALEPDGVMLSNGPGDPSENVFCVKQIEKLIGRVPIFGICLGHQLAALAMGGRTMKLKYGHRGANQPVRDLNGTRTYITSQNHGYAAVADSLRSVGAESFANSNDGSNEGMDYPEHACFTVQFHPEACAGPCDTSYLFDRFVSMMESDRHAKG